MKLILVTFLLAAISVYVFIDYENIKCLVTGVNPNQEIVAEVIIDKPDNVEYKPKKPEEPATKFLSGDVVYIDTSVGDKIAWPQNELPLWKTYDGSEKDEFQNTDISLPHRIKVKVIKSALGAENVTWYYIRTATGLPISGWAQEKYLSKELPKRRRGKTGDWGS